MWAWWALASAIVGVSVSSLIILATVTGLGTPTQEGVKIDLDALGALIAVTWLAGGFVSALAQWVVFRPYIPGNMKSQPVGAHYPGRNLLAGLLYGCSPIVIIVIGTEYGAVRTLFSGLDKSVLQRELANLPAIIGMFLLIAGVWISAITGLAQWVALRRYLPHAWKLILSNILAALIFQLLVLTVAYATAGEPAISGKGLWSTILLGWNATQILSGIVTGITLVQLFQAPPTDNKIIPD